MKAIIYTSSTATNAALKRCSKEIAQGIVTKIVDGEEVPAGEDEKPADKPYSFIVEHPAGGAFALVADDKVVELLDEQAVELGDDWFSDTAPASNTLDVPPQEPYVDLRQAPEQKPIVEPAKTEV